MEDILIRFNMDIALDEPVWKLSIGAQQWVELIKLLIRDCRILILDEPTAVLTPQEAEKLFAFLGKLREEGKSIVFISHKMREVMALSDRVTILKKGATVESLIKGDFDENILANLMIGGDDIPKWERHPKEIGGDILVIENVSVDNDKGLRDLKDFFYDSQKRGNPRHSRYSRKRTKSFGRSYHRSERTKIRFYRFRRSGYHLRRLPQLPAFWHSPRPRR